MTFLKEILSELYSNVGTCVTGMGHPNKGAEPSRLPSVWSKDVVNQVSRQSREDELYLRQRSGIRNDEMPMDDEGSNLRAADIDDYGDIRGGDDNAMRGYDGQADGPQDDMYADEFEEVLTVPCPDCEGGGHHLGGGRGNECERCGGSGEVGRDTLAYDEEEEGLLGKIRDHLEGRRRNRLSKKLSKKSDDASQKSTDAYFGTGEEDSDAATDYDYTDERREPHEQEFVRQSKRSRRYGKAAAHYAEEEEDETEQGPVGADLEKPPSDEVSDEQIDDQYGTSDPDGENEFSDDVEQEWDDPNLQGVIRTVPNAHLIYKRQQEDGTFNELWQYNIGDDFRKELEVRRAILAGTDIPPNKMSSPDNTQSFELWTAGNAQVMHVRGLPN